MKKERLDKILVDRGMAGSLRKAQAIIMAGLVSSGGERLDKPGRLIAVDFPLIVEKPQPYVGRGGLKLEEALDVFKIDVEGRVCADIGSSTGGFTDCLLQRGAAKVYAVDVDIRQLDARLRADPRVVTVEKNARYLEPADFLERPTLAVMDVSFISILKVLPALKRILEWGEGIASSPRKGGASRNDTILLSLIKPQFEAEKGLIGSKGLVRDPDVHRAVLAGVARGAGDLGFRLHGFVRCSTRGQKGNQEFFGLWSLAGAPSATTGLPTEAVVDAWIADVTRDPSP
jgi:23S rRNA (cytidine1920-2'-O)/16S rRNA (cytidine1409-2'-O)-methyltransferase